MIRPPQTLLVTTTATVGLLLLWFQRIYGNTPLLEGIVPAADSTATILALLVSGFTSPVTVVLIAVAGGLFAAYEHHAKLWWLFASLLAVGAAASSLLKELIQLDRPEVALVPLSSYGFPSTHATLATIILITVVWFVYYWRQQPHQLIVGLTTAGWLLICSSRILLGVHSLSDVLAGIMLGISIATVAITVAPRLFQYWNITLNN